VLLLARATRPVPGLSRADVVEAVLRLLVPAEAAAAAGLGVGIGLRGWPDAAVLAIGGVAVGATFAAVAAVTDRPTLRMARAVLSRGRARDR
jgi:hypothetical protein